MNWKINGINNIDSDTLDSNSHIRYNDKIAPKALGYTAIFSVHARIHAEASKKEDYLHLDGGSRVLSHLKYTEHIVQWMS